MPDVAEFFDGVSRRGHEYLPRKTEGTIRIDLTRGDQVEHWLVAIKAGNVFVSRDDREADTVLRIDGALFEQVITGEVSILAALLRSEASVQGRVPLMWSFRRTFPSAPGARHPRQMVTDREAPR